MKLTREERGLLYRLAGRHSDIGFIRAYMLREFGRAPTREMIASVREGLNAYAKRNSNSHTRSSTTAQQANYARRYSGATV